MRLCCRTTGGIVREEDRINRRLPILIRMMNIERGISNHEVGSRKSSLLSWTFYIRYSAVRFSTFTHIAEQQRAKGLIPFRKILTALWKGRLLDDPQVPLSPAAQFVFGIALKLHEGIRVELIVLCVVWAPVINLAPVHIPGRNWAGHGVGVILR